MDWDFSEMVPLRKKYINKQSLAIEALTGLDDRSLVGRATTQNVLGPVQTGARKPGRVV
jgi:hypothetical protein